MITALVCVYPQMNVRASSNEAVNTLSIRHISKSPDGGQQILGVETIENITDIYYYTAQASPVASEFLKNGYKLADEKNRVIEADVVTNGGKIDLEYTPELKTIEVTYYKSEGGEEKKMGTISDSAYVGAEYAPQLPVYEETDVLTALVSDVKYIVGPGENRFNVSYTVTKKPDEEPQITTPVRRRERLTEGEVAYLTNIPVNSDKESASANQADKSRSNNDITKNELFPMLSRAAGGFFPNSASFEDILGDLTGKGITPNVSYDMYETVTWNEFRGYIDGLGEYVYQDGASEAPETGHMLLYVDGNANVTRDEASAIINETVQTY